MQPDICFKCDRTGTPADSVMGPRSGGLVHIACLDPDLRELYYQTVAVPRGWDKVDTACPSSSNA